ncbi:XVIPCD domain-containing protein [Dyella sp.]|uniref:XVIPCD domain-containing protein n=1 Tax=Dyella sp. TaxID=1869338 RepID=UPI002ED5BE2C
MDVVSDKRITSLEATQGTTRVYGLEDGNWLVAHGGTVAWRNNNPGNMKFGYADSADKTVHTHRTHDQALHAAQTRYDGVVALDQWGNAVFESYEAGRKAQEKLLTHDMGDKTVEQLVEKYSTNDYSGVTHHKAQIATIYATASAEGIDLHGKKVQDMSAKELDALADGLSKAEGWKAGTVQHTKPLSKEELHNVLSHPSAQNHTPEPHPAQHAATHTPAQPAAQHATTHAPTQPVEQHAATHATAQPAAQHATTHVPAQSVTQHAAPHAPVQHATPHAPEHHAAPKTQHEVYREGDRSQGVQHLQENLNKLGAHDAHGMPLQTDHKFGQHTKEAVQAFQHAHGLKADGIAGDKTLGAIAQATRHSPHLNDAAHPAHEMYKQAHGNVSRLDQQHGRTPGPHTDNFSGALTAAAVGAGMSRIDHVILSDDAKKGYAVQGDLNSPFKQYTAVDVAQAIQTPVAQSSAQAMQQPQHAQAQQQAQTQTQNQAQVQVRQHQPPGMGGR